MPSSSSKNVTTIAIHCAECRMLLRRQLSLPVSLPTSLPPLSPGHAHGRGQGAPPPLRVSAGQVHLCEGTQHPIPRAGETGGVGGMEGTRQGEQGEESKCREGDRKDGGNKLNTKIGFQRNIGSLPHLLAAVWFGARVFQPLHAFPSVLRPVCQTIHLLLPSACVAHLPSMPLPACVSHLPSMPLPACVSHLPSMPLPACVGASADATARRTCPACCRWRTCTTTCAASNRR